VRAQTDEERQAALDTFQRGKTLMAEKRYADACRAFEDSLRLIRGVGTLYQLAECRVALGQNAIAWKLYQDAAVLAERDGATDRARAARERAKTIEATVAIVRVELAEPTAGLELRFDSGIIDAGEWRAPRAVAAGQHRLEAGAPARLPWTQELMFAPGSSHVVSVPALRRVEAAASRGLPPTRIASIALGVAGFVSLGVGTGFGVVALRKSSEYKVHCNAGCGCHPEHMSGALTPPPGPTREVA
jgi:hypothetical protein